MFCSICNQLIKDEASNIYLAQHPESTVLSSTINKPSSSLLVLLEISSNGKNRLEYEGVEGTQNFCINCGSKLND
jgi:hypothetical protein